MRRIDSPDAVADKNGAGRDGFGTAVETPPAGTHLTPEFLNETQEAICRAIELAGLTLTDDDHEQLYDAMVAVSESRTLQDGMAAYGGDGTVNQGANDLEFRGSGALRLAAGKSLKLENTGETQEVSVGAPFATESYNYFVPNDAPTGNQVARAASGGQHSWIVLDSGTYTPVASGVSGCTLSNLKGRYWAVGNEVKFSLACQLEYDALTDSADFTLSLPDGSFTNGYSSASARSDGQLTMTAENTAGGTVSITLDTTQPAETIQVRVDGSYTVT